MEYGDLESRIYGIFHPEPIIGNEGAEFYEMPPLPRLTKEYGLDTTYWAPFEYGSSSDLLRRARDENDDIGSIVRAQTVPFELFMGTFQLFGDSILAYHGEKNRVGPYRFYPAVLMAAWASFEAFVRISSELLVKTARALPNAVRLVLLEREERLDRKGNVNSRRRLQPLLERYWLLLKFGYAVDYDRGSRIWQLGEAAISKRNALVHYEIEEMPSLKTAELWQHLEAILLLLIGPSTVSGKSVMANQYELYGVIDVLRELIEEFEERPHFKGWSPKLDGVIFPCPFENIDDDLYPLSFPDAKRFKWTRPKVLSEE